MIHIVKLYKSFCYYLVKSRQETTKFDFKLFLKIWVNDHLLKKSPLDANLPWMPYSAIFELNSIIKPNFNILETGCGGSTIFFLKNSQSVISIEHDEKWIQKLRKHPQIAKQNAEWQLICTPISDLSENKLRTNYLDSLRIQKDNSFDLICIDGRLRSKSLILASQKLRDGGFLILDNADRDDYKEGIEFINRLGWQSKEMGGICYGYNWDSYATIWQKP